MRISDSGMTTITDQVYEETKMVLKTKQEAFGFLVCCYVKYGLGNKKEAKRRARICIAANNGYNNFINDFQERG